MKASSFGYNDSLVDTSSVIYKSEGRVILSITSQDHMWNILIAHLTPDEARKMAQELIVNAYKVDSESLEG